MTFSHGTVLDRRIPAWFRLYAWWTVYSTPVLRFAVAFMAAGAGARMLNESRRLLFETGRSGAVDLRLRYYDVANWFAGMPVYTGPSHAGYPPATYVMLWPFLGWLELWQARWLWGLLPVVVLAVLTAVALRHSRAETRL